MTATPRASAYGPESLVGSVTGFAVSALPMLLGPGAGGWPLAAPVVVLAVAVVLVCLPDRRRLGIGVLVGVTAYAVTGLGLVALFLVALSTSGPPVPPVPA